jgi:hypothetical protein
MPHTGVITQLPLAEGFTEAMLINVRADGY